MNTEVIYPEETRSSKTSLSINTQQLFSEITVMITDFSRRLQRYNPKAENLSWNVKYLNDEQQNKESSALHLNLEFKDKIKPIIDIDIIIGRNGTAAIDGGITDTSALNEPLIDALRENINESPAFELFVSNVKQVAINSLHRLTSVIPVHNLPQKHVLQAIKDSLDEMAAFFDLMLDHIPNKYIIT